MTNSKINQNYLLTLLALKAVKARYLQKQYEHNTYDGVSDEYSKQVQAECIAEVQTVESIAQVIDADYYKERKHKFRKEMNAHIDSYKLTYITDMIEMYEGYLKDDQD